MPTGPNGERRPRDVIGCAVMVAQIATGEIEEPTPAPRPKRRREALIGAKGPLKKRRTFRPPDPS